MSNILEFIGGLTVGILISLTIIAFVKSKEDIG